MLAMYIEAFLMDQVENDSFELQEGNESDDSAARFLYNINRQITASEVTPETSAAVPNRPYYSVTTELKKPRRLGPTSMSMRTSDRPVDAGGSRLP